MKLSIIIPVYNEASYLERCLDSILVNASKSQLKIKKDFEVIVVDDASTDGSSEICDEYSKVGFQIHHNAINEGVSFSRNVGLTAAQGEYITFLDSDDEYTFDAFKIMLDAMEEYPDQPVIQFNHYRNYVKKQKTVVKFPSDTGIYTRRELPFFWFGVWNKLYKKDFLQENRIWFDWHLSYGEDEIFNLCCLYYNPKIFCIKKITVIKNIQNPNSLTRTNNKQNLIKQSKAILEALNDSQDPEYDDMIRKIMSEHWESKTYRKIIGGKTC